MTYSPVPPSPFLAFALDHPLLPFKKSAFEILLMVVLPGKSFKANPTQSGHIPVYKANGMFSYIVTMVTVCVLVNTGRLVPRVFRMIWRG